MDSVTVIQFTIYCAALVYITPLETEALISPPQHVFNFFNFFCCCKLPVTL